MVQGFRPNTQPVMPKNNLWMPVVQRKCFQVLKSFLLRFSLKLLDLQNFKRIHFSKVLKLYN